MVLARGHRVTLETHSGMGIEFLEYHWSPCGKAPEVIIPGLDKIQHSLEHPKSEILASSKASYTTGHVGRRGLHSLQQALFQFHHSVSVSLCFSAVQGLQAQMLCWTFLPDLCLPPGYYYSVVADRAGASLRMFQESPISSICHHSTLHFPI